MKIEDYDKDYVELSLKDLHRMTEENNEIEIDLDDYFTYVEEHSYQNAEEEEMEFVCQKRAQTMRESLENKLYHKAFENAKELKHWEYSKYRDEIENCYEECAMNNVFEALVYEADKYTKRGDGIVRPEAFPYLYKLNEMGYIKSFRWLADCYYRGIGCEHDQLKAEKLYLEAMLFDDSNYSRNMYMRLKPELHDYAGDDLLKRLIQCYVCDDGEAADFVRIKIAELILDRKIKEYEPETAYALLKRKYDYDGISYYRLGECILDGIGTERDPIIALYVLEMALGDLEWIIEDFDDEWTREMIRDSFHVEQDYIRAYEETKNLIERAKQEKNKLSEYDIVCAHNGMLDEDEIIEAWEKETTDFIKRSRR